MRKAAAPLLLLAAGIGGLSLGSYTGHQDRDLALRVAELEKWRAVVEPRLQRLEELTASAVGVERLQKAAEEDRAFGIITVEVSNKTWEDVLFTRTRYKDAVTWDATYKAVGLDKPARAVRGTYVFSDLFGEEKLTVPVEIRKEFAPGAEVVVEDEHFDYLLNKQSHRWVRTTPLAEMKIRFRVDAIVFTDGSIATF